LFQQLLDKALQGDKASENEILSQLRVRFHYLAKRRIGEADAEDIAQEACITVLEKYHTEMPPAGFEAWAYGVLRKKIGNYLQSREVRRRVTVSGRQPDDVLDPARETVDPALKMRLIHCLKNLVGSFPRYARVLNLIHLGYNTTEICARIRVKPNNLYVMLNRGRRMLKDCVEKGLR
jgi:RNA polymerase sigma factor (sigma-70 family)